jgi:branched-chain amino acid transport system substrate-binding protein
MQFQTIKKVFVATVLPLSLVLSIVVSGQVLAQDTIRIAYLDPLSGTFAATGESGLHQIKYAVEKLVNEKGGVWGGRKIEVVSFDNKGSPTDTQIQLKRIISSDIHFVFSGNSSAVASVISDTLDKHNRRNPDNQVLYLNYSAVDPALTERDCNFWHFRFDAHADIKMDALTDHIANNKAVKSVYIIGQDYSFGKTVSASARDMLKKKRPDIEIVGDELHPIGLVKDFTPYVTKIGSSKADAVITGNWGADMVALARSIADAGLDLPIYTYYGAYDGTTATLGEAGKNRIYLVHQGRANKELNDDWRKYNADFKARHPNFDITYPRMVYAIDMLAKAITKAKSIEPQQVAYALEGMEYTTMLGEDVWMRSDDHQLFADLSVSVQTNEGIEIDADNSGYGLVTQMAKPMEETFMDTSCRMRRPSGG